MPNLEWIIFTEVKYTPSDFALNLLQLLIGEVSEHN